VRHRNFVTWQRWSGVVHAASRSAEHQELYTEAESPLNTKKQSAKVGAIWNPNPVPDCDNFYRLFLEGSLSAGAGLVSFINT